MLTVKDIVSILQFGEFDDKYGKEVPRLTVSADGLATHINPENKLEMAAYGDFIIDLDPCGRVGRGSLREKQLVYRRGLIRPQF